MSLINQALKHAQRRQSAPPPGYDTVGGLACRPRKSKAMKVLIGFLASGILLVAGAGYALRYSAQLFESADASAATAAAKPSKAAKTEPAPAGASKTKHPEEPADAAGTEGASAPNKAKAEPSSPDFEALKASFTPEQLTALKRMLAQEAAAADDPAAAAGEAGDSFDNPDPAVKNPAIAAFVAALDIQGVRAAGEKSRILVDGRVYRVGQLVDLERGVRLQHVEHGVLIFADKRGTLYPRTL